MVGHSFDKTPDEKNAQKVKSLSLASLGKILLIIGNPFYLFLTSLVIGFLFLSFWSGKTISTLLVAIGDLTIAVFSPIRSITKIIKTISLPSVGLPKLRIPKIKVTFPKPRLSTRSMVALSLVTAFTIGFWFVILKDTPSPRKLIDRDIEVSTKIYDRNGILLYKIYKEKNRTIVPLSEIPIHVRLATLAAEDAEFYSHPGFSIRGITRAIIKNLTSDELTGGSTITQQLVKNALLTPKKTIVRKIREIILSVGTELAFTKDEILAMYLNEVSYGGTAYGIQEAARIYFGKDVDHLTLAESAFLSSLPKSPTKFSPFGPTPELGLARQKDVINLMVINKFITEKDAQKALEEKLVFAPNRTEILAPHFVMYVRQILEEKYGREVVEQGGLEVITTLDYSIQILAEKAVKEEIDKLTRLNVGNGAALVLDPQTGEVLAMVGSKDYFNTAEDGNVNVTTSLRPPGSSIKVINYAQALSTTYTPASILSDTPVTFSVPGQPPYSPKNYDGGYRGNLSLRSAFAESRNVPAVKVLASYGIDKMIELGQKMGITTWEEKGRFGLSLTLGGGEVKLTDLAQVYATVANYGKRSEITSLKKVSNYKGEVFEQNECGKKEKSLISFLSEEITASETQASTCEGEEMLDPRVAYLLIDILSDNSARAPAFGTHSELVIPNHPEVAVKTGTSNDLRDNWTIGFNKDYLVAVWVGNNDNSPMSRVASGITGASPIFNKIMSPLLSQNESVDWEVPVGLAQIPICSLTGTLPCSGCPVRNEWFLKDNIPLSACNPETFLVKEKDKKPKERILPEAARTEVRRGFFNF